MGAMNTDTPARSRPTPATLQEQLLGQQHKAYSLRQIFTVRMADRQNQGMPRRIVSAIEQQDNSAEVLVRIIQLSIGIVLGALYLAAPRTDLGTAFSPVPYALAVYLTLTFVGLVWSMTRALPSWAIYLSILFDMILLMGLIWSFHVQYQQPPSFYLKAPTFLYVFIFVSLRALRFQARYVIAAGLVAVLAWLMMIAYVILSDPENSMITHDYVTYMTSNAILIGGEIDKIVSILLVTTILALVIRRARALLVNAVAEQAAARELSRFFDDEVAGQIRNAEQSIAAGEGINRDAAILNVDIRGFTSAAAKMDANAVMSMLTDYQQVLVPVIQSHGGTIDKFMGDGIMASFGAVSPSSTFAADGLRAMAAVMDAARKWSRTRAQKGLPVLAVNAALAAGPVVFGAVGGKSRLEYTVIGAAVNLSAKLEKHNKVLGSTALTTRETLELALAQGYTPPHPPGMVRQSIDGTGQEMELVVYRDTP